MNAIEVKENISRLENTIELNFWNAGYVANCKEALLRYKEMAGICANEGCDAPAEEDEELCYGCDEHASAVSFGIRTSH